MTTEATNSEAEAPEMEAETDEVATTQTDDDVSDAFEEEEVEGDESAEDQSDAEDDDLEEVEFDGVKARVPPAIKAGLMRNADYTRKTQEVAEVRKALDQREQALSQQAETVQSLAEDYGKVHALNTQIKALEAVDWDALDREAMASDDPIAAQAEINKLERQYRRLVAERDTAQKDLDGKVEERRLQSEREVANAMQETSRQLADPKTGIKDWGPEKARALADLAASEGVSIEEIKHADARTWKLLDRLHRAEALVAKQTKATNISKAQAAGEPAKKVVGKSVPPSGLDDRLSQQEWLRRRNAQIAERRRA